MEVIRKPDKCINAFCTSVCSGADVETMDIIFGGNPKNCPRYKCGRDEYLTEHDKQIRADVIDECKMILLGAIAKTGMTKCNEYILAINEMDQLKEK